MVASGAGRAARRCLYSLAHVADRGVRRVERPRGAIGIPAVALVLALVVVGRALVARRSQLPDLRRRVRPRVRDRPDALTAIRRRQRSPGSCADWLARRREGRGGRQPAHWTTTRSGDHVGFARRWGRPAMCSSPRLGHVHPGIDDQAADWIRRALGDRPADPVHDQRRLGRRPDSCSSAAATPTSRSRSPRVRSRDRRRPRRRLAARTAAALKRDGVDQVALGYDASLFTGPSASPGWEASYVSGNIVTPVSALWADQGVANGVRSRDPAAERGQDFARLLEDRGITVAGDPDAGRRRRRRRRRSRRCAARRSRRSSKRWCVRATTRPPR